MILFYQITVKAVYGDDFAGVLFTQRYKSFHASGIQTGINFGNGSVI